MNEPVLSKSQEIACNAFQDFLASPQKEFLLSGFAGSGKTFLVKYLVDLARDEHELARLIAPTTPAMKFHFTATTNKAARVLSEAMAEPARTIHQALGLTIQKNFKTGKEYLVQKKNGKAVSLNYATLIVDEASMINAELLRYIQKAVRGTASCKILYVGDKYQLPPVKENSCPIFENVATKYFLTDIQRQAADSPIIQFAHKYREIIDDSSLEWPTIPHDPPFIHHFTDGKAWEELIRQEYAKDHHPDDLRVLAWENERVIQYNKFIRTSQGLTSPYYVGEVMMSNSPIIFDETVAIPTDGLVVIHSIDDDEQCGIPGYTISVSNYQQNTRYHLFQPADWKQAGRYMARLKKEELWQEFYEIKDTWLDLRSVHAQTVHKSQGSTYKKVFIDVDNLGKNQKWYEVARLMYVAITRASQEVYLFGGLKDRYDRTKNPSNLMEAFRNATTCV